MIIPGYTAYDITPDGVVTEISTGKVLRHVKSQEYTNVYVQRDSDGWQSYVGVHRLLALAFAGPQPENAVAYFLDKNTHNLHASNVAWITREKLSATRINWTQCRRTSKCNTEATRTAVLNAIKASRVPITTAELSYKAHLSYSTVRYSVQQLEQENKILRVYGGFILAR